MVRRRDGGFKINEAGAASRNTGQKLLSDSHRTHDRPFSQRVSLLCLHLRKKASVINAHLEDIGEDLCSSLIGPFGKTHEELSA